MPTVILCYKGVIGEWLGQKSDFNKRDPSSLHVDLVLKGIHLTPKWLHWLWVQLTAIKVYLGFP